MLYNYINSAGRVNPLVTINKYRVVIKIEPAIVKLMYQTFLYQDFLEILKRSLRNIFCHNQQRVKDINNDVIDMLKCLHNVTLLRRYKVRLLILIIARTV